MDTFRCRQTSSACPEERGHGHVLKRFRSRAEGEAWLRKEAEAVGSISLGRPARHSVERRLGGQCRCPDLAQSACRRPLERLRETRRTQQELEVVDLPEAPSRPSSSWKTAGSRPTGSTAGTPKWSGFGHGIIPHRRCPRPAFRRNLRPLPSVEVDRAAEGRGSTAVVRTCVKTLDGGAGADHWSMAGTEEEERGIRGKLFHARWFVCRTARRSGLKRRKPERIAPLPKNPGVRSIRSSVKRQGDVLFGHHPAQVDQGVAHAAERRVDAHVRLLGDVLKLMPLVIRMCTTSRCSTGSWSTRA